MYQLTLGAGNFTLGAKVPLQFLSFIQLLCVFRNQQESCKMYMNWGLQLPLCFDRMNLDHLLIFKMTWLSTTPFSSDHLRNGVFCRNILTIIVLHGA